MQKNVDCTEWRALVAHSGMSWPGQVTSTDMLFPDWPSLHPLPRCLSSFNPNRNHNDDAFDALAKTLPAPRGTFPVLGLFCADPFLQPRTVLRRLEPHGGMRIVNFPAISMLGPEFVEVTQEVGIGPSAEVTFLKSIQAAGRQVGFAISNPDEADFWGSGQPDFWLAIPGFDAVKGNNVRTDPVLGLTKYLADRDTSQVILMSPGSAVSSYAAVSVGASGIIHL